MPDKAIEQMQQIGIIHENAWLVLGPFDNTAAIGYNTEYITDCGLPMLTETFEDLQINDVPDNQFVGWVERSETHRRQFSDFYSCRSGF